MDVSEGSIFERPEVLVSDSTISLAVIHCCHEVGVLSNNNGSDFFRLRISIESMVRVIKGLTQKGRV